jgi:xanthine/uracil/vitamin C permease (AzgA family)
MQTFKNHMTAGISVFFSVWTLTFLYTHIMQSIGLSPHHWFSTVCLICGMGCLFSALFIKQPYVIAPGISIGLFASHLITHPSENSNLFIAIMLVGAILIIISNIPTIKKTKEIIPSHLQEAINIGIGLLFIRIAVEQQFASFSNQLNISTFLFFLSIFSLFFFRMRQNRWGIFITVFICIVVSVLTHHTHWTGLFARPTGLMILPQLPPPSHYLEIFKNTVELGLFAIFDSAAGYFCLYQLQQSLHHDVQPRLPETYFTVGLNNLLAGFFLCGPNTVFIEGSVGIQLGAKNYQSTLVVACCFALFLFCFPLGDLIPAELFKGILAFIGLSLLTGIYHLRKKTNYEIWSTLLIVFIICIRKSILDGLIVGILITWIHQYLNKIDTQPLLKWGGALGVFTFVLRYLV